MIAESPPEITSPAPALATPDDREVVISVRNVGKMYRIYEKPQDRLKQMLMWRFGKSYGHEFWAVRDVSFDVRRGETVGIIGRNGSGKSTLLQMIAGTLAPTEGEVEVRGRVAALLELGSGFNPEFTGRENVFLNGAILGLSREEMTARFDEIAAFADIGEFIEQPVKTYSSGMVVRLAFAVASCVNPDILIIDEALAVGDVLFQTRCLDRIKLLSNRGTTVLFVTHDTGSFQNLCDYGYVLNKGVLFTEGRPAMVAMQYYELMRESEHARQRIAVQSEDQAPEQVEVELTQKLNEIRAKVDDGEYRFGTALARIVDYQISDSIGRETSSLKIGEPFTVTVRVEFYGYVANLALGVMFRNAQGQNLMGMHSFVEHRVNFGAHDVGEQIEILVTQEMLLNPGDYVLSVGLADCRTDYDFTSLDNRSNLTKVSVFGKPLGYGLIHTRPSFEISGAPLRQQTWQDMQWKDWTDWLLERCHRYASNAQHVFEIGGVGKELGAFLLGRSFTTLNYPTGDICRRTEYADNSFDLIVSKMTFEHLYDPFSAADEMTRLLAPGGIVIIMTVWSWRYHTAPGFDDYWRFSNTGLEQLFPALEIVESGFDLSDRRKDGRLDRVPVDVLGGWREHWYVYLVARKPTHATARIEGSNRRSNLALLGMSLDQIKEAYSLVLESSEIASVVSEILEHGRDQQQAVTDMEQEERAWPGESRFVDSGYYRQMLGRYAFAGSQFCRDADVLETGCGLGWGAYLVGHYARHVTAFDLDPVTIQYCAETWKTDTIRWLTGDARDLGFLQGQRYDVCLGMETIEHFSAQDGATYVAAVASVLRPGGIFIGTSAFPESQQEALAMQEFNPYHPHIFTHDEMLGLLKQHFNRAAIIGNWMFIAIK